MPLLLTTMNDVQIKGTQQLKKVNYTTNFLDKKFEKVEADKRKKEGEIAVLKSTLNVLTVNLD